MNKFTSNCLKIYNHYYKSINKVILSKKKLILLTYFIVWKVYLSFIQNNRIMKRGI